MTLESCVPHRLHSFGAVFRQKHLPCDNSAAAHWQNLAMPTRSMQMLVVACLQSVGYLAIKLRATCSFVLQQHLMAALV